MKKKTAKNILCAAVDMIIFCLTLYSVVRYMTTGVTGNMSGSGTTCFRYFTIDSNVLCAVSCLLTALCVIFKGSLSKALLVFKFTATAAVTLTMMTVLIFLGPLFGYPPMFEGCNLWMHLVNPLLAIISLLFLVPGDKISFRDSLFGLIPVILYGAVYFIMVICIGVQNGGWPDFYGFNMGGRWYLSVILMAAGIFVICVLLMVLRNNLFKSFGGSENG